MSFQIPYLEKICNAVVIRQEPSLAQMLGHLHLVTLGKFSFACHSTTLPGPVVASRMPPGPQEDERQRGGQWLRVQLPGLLSAAPEALLNVLTCTVRVEFWFEKPLTYAQLQDRRIMRKNKV